MYKAKVNVQKEEINKSKAIVGDFNTFVLIPSKKTDIKISKHIRGLHTLLTKLP